MAESGYVDWTPGSGTGGLLFEKPWMGGAFTSKGMMTGLSWTERPTMRLVEFHDGTHERVGTYRGDKAPLAYSHFTFSFSWRHKFDADYQRLRALFNGGSTFSFAVGLRCTDTFDATSGSTYTISRAVAAGTVTGITTSTHPHLVYLDGTLTPSAASLSGRTLTANNTGTIRFEYTPLFTVEFASFSSQIADTNIFDSAITLVEAISGDFS